MSARKHRPPVRRDSLGRRIRAGAIVDLPPEPILERIRSGESVRDIAASMSVHPITIYTLLLRQAPEQWKETAAAMALQRLEKAEEELEIAADQTAVARARSLAEISRWKLERLLRRYFGTDALPAGGQVSISIGLLPVAGAPRIAVQHDDLALTHQSGAEANREKSSG